ncbi:hypothetical protein R1flu_007985 [Riccia fluitans]|uniref:Uncharacterized protein n=1 Tax=Riccia fluitans TaxID=41844 RepID=A0ABD1YAK7_9MARC
MTVVGISSFSKFSIALDRFVPELRLFLRFVTRGGAEECARGVTGRRIGEGREGDSTSEMEQYSLISISERRIKPRTRKPVPSYTSLFRFIQECLHNSMKTFHLATLAGVGPSASSKKVGKGLAKMRRLLSNGLVVEASRGVDRVEVSCSPISNGRSEMRLDPAAMNELLLRDRGGGQVEELDRFFPVARSVRREEMVELSLALGFAKVPCSPERVERNACCAKRSVGIPLQPAGTPARSWRGEGVARDVLNAEKGEQGFRFQREDRGVVRLSRVQKCS